MKNNHLQLSKVSKKYEWYLTASKSLFTIPLPDPFRSNLFHRSHTIKCEHVSQSCYLTHRGINYLGGSVNANVNLSYMWKTFDRVDRGAMYTNQPMEMTQTLRDTNKPRHGTAKMSVFIWAPAFALHLMGSEKQYYMCQEIWQTAANETWHRKSHISAMKQ